MSFAEPPPKAAAPPLMARAAPPPPLRIRRSVAVGIVGAGAVLIAAALAWAFVVQPDLRQRARAEAAEAASRELPGAVRPSEAVTAQPATYDRLTSPPIAEDRLPPPRVLGPGAATSPAAAEPPVSVRSPRVQGSAPHPPTAAAADLQEAKASGLFFKMAAAPPAAAAPTSERASPGAIPSATLELKAGTIIPAVLLTAADTARSGAVLATVSENVFDSLTGQTLLLPQGARLLGQQAGDSRHGERRIYLKWDRLVLPNGDSIDLAGEPAVDAAGAPGAPAQVRRRIGPLAGAALLAGAITTLGQAARDRGGGGGLLGDAGDAAAIEASQLGGKLIDRELEVRPSLTAPAGAQVHVLLTRDLALKAYRP